MIDREARDRAATLLRRFADGEITNEDFYADYPRSGEDPALRAVFDEAWYYYSDLKTHYLVGKHALTEEGRDVFARCEFFLLSDLEYRYPKNQFSGLGRPGIFLILFTLGIEWLLYLRRRRRDEYLLHEREAAGDISVWPFPSRADYEAAKLSLSPSR
ncbi:MAG: hypothetical protein KF714_11280 [Parvibaculum sp.]|nr:hypothetical protein [Parvibaculum sp.]